MTKDDKIRFLRAAINMILRNYNISEDTRKALEEALKKTKEQWIEEE